MKIAILFVFALFLALAGLTYAQTPAAPPGNDNAEAKTSLYEKFFENRSKNSAVAYEAGKEYVSKYAAADGDKDQYVAGIKKWIASYEKATRRNTLVDLLKSNKANESFAMAKQVLADFPDDLGIIYSLASVGYSAATKGNESNNAEAIQYANQTIKLIESGKSFEVGKPFEAKDKDEKIALFHYMLGTMQLKSTPTEARDNFMAAVQSDTTLKSEPVAYVNLFNIYQNLEYQPVFTQYKTDCNTPEKEAAAVCTDMSGKIDKIVDRMMDALARAIAYANSSAKPDLYSASVTAWTKLLTALYQYRNNGSDVGVTDLIAKVTSKPIPR